MGSKIPLGCGTSLRTASLGDTGVTMPGMAVLSRRDLRTSSDDIMDRVEAGETFTVTRHGRPVARLVPMAGPRQAVVTAELRAAFAGLPRVDAAQLRRDADEFFDDDGDRVG